MEFEYVNTFKRCILQLTVLDAFILGVKGNSERINGKKKSDKSEARTDNAILDFVV